MTKLNIPYRQIQTVEFVAQVNMHFLGIGFNFQIDLHIYFL